MLAFSIFSLRFALCPRSRNAVYAVGWCVLTINLFKIQDEKDKKELCVSIYDLNDGFSPFSQKRSESTPNVIQMRLLCRSFS